MRVKSGKGISAAILLAVLALGGCYDQNDHSPTAPETVNALTLTAAASTLPADGFSRIELVARIDPDADADHRSVVFTTTAGTLVGSTAADKRSLTVPADTSGAARAFLQSSNLVETAIVQASVANAASVVKSLEISFQAVSSTELLRIGVSTTSAPADGATVIQVYADLAANTPANQRSVTFTSSAGTLISNTATANDSNRATVDLEARRTPPRRGSPPPPTAPARRPPSTSSAPCRTPSWCRRTKPS